MTRRTRAGAVAAVARVAAVSVVLAGLAAAFSPHRGAPPTAPVRAAGPGIAVGGSAPVAPSGPSRGGTGRTRLAYKYLPNDGAEHWGASGAGNETGLVRELEGADRGNGARIDGDEAVAPEEEAAPLRSVEPPEARPSRKFVSPIQLIKKVPKVEPIANSTVFVLRVSGDPAWPAPAGEAPGDVRAPAVESWETAVAPRRGASFAATSYLEALGADAKKGDGVNTEGGEDDLLKSLREQQAQLRNERLKSQQDAIYEASRRTSPQEAVDKRIEEGEKKRKRKEREMLEKLYVERKERLDAKRRDEEQHNKAMEEPVAIPEGKAQEPTADEEAAGEGAEEGVGESEEEAPDRFRQGVPVLDRPYADAPPLLIGSTLTLPYEEMAKFQRRAIDLARERHEEHRRRTDGGGDGIRAAPLIAVIDGYTAAAGEALSVPVTLPSDRPTMERRYATLAAVEIVEGNDGTPSAVELFGVKRVFLCDHFSSNDEGPTPDEAGLDELLARIREMDCPALDNEENDGDHELPVVVAKYDAAPDGEGGAGRPFHVLHLRANRVYRLHEERKKLAEGLRAAEARLRRGRGGGGRMASVLDEACLVELLDSCDGPGGWLLLGTVPDDGESDADEPPGATELDLDGAAPPPRSRLEALENYGLGSYGATSTVPDLARRLAEELEPYSAPDRRGREEREADVASHAALLSLAEYAEPEEVAEALVAPTSAARRLERASALMERHRDELRGLVEVVSRELTECGEEYTDMW